MYNKAVTFNLQVLSMVEDILMYHTENLMHHRTVTLATNTLT